MLQDLSPICVTCVSEAHTHVPAQRHGESSCPVQMPCSGLSAGAEGASTQAGCLRPLPCTPHVLPVSHNKWSKVKLIKGPRDVDRSWLFQKLAMPCACRERHGGGRKERILCVTQLQSRLWLQSPPAQP
uniref:Uncharacterized protein n=1 Tax=Chrysemys picta bellii TaxID=8478 RepID=A0A8C3HAX4_CHRPI